MSDAVPIYQVALPTAFLSSLVSWSRFRYFLHVDWHCHKPIMSYMYTAELIDEPHNYDNPTMKQDKEC